MVGCYRRSYCVDRVCDLRRITAQNGKALATNTRNLYCGCLFGIALIFAVKRNSFNEAPPPIKCCGILAYLYFWYSLRYFQYIINFLPSIFL